MSKGNLLFRWRNTVKSEDGPPSPTTRHVLLTLSLHMRADGANCWPSTATLEKECKLSEKCVCDHLELAREQGWIVSAPREKNGQGWRLNQYWPRIPEAEGTERGSARRTEGRSAPLNAKALNLTPEGTERHSEGTEPDVQKALNQVQSRSSIRSSKRSSRDPSTPEERKKALDDMRAVIRGKQWKP